MTVGKMVTEHWTYMDSLEAATSPATALRIFQNILSSLGLWDAEVLEMNATSGPGWMDLMEPVGEGEPLDLPEGRVRFIVLPKEEECK